MLKVMTIVGTRPELIKMSRVIDEFDKNSNHILVHTGQNYDYELNQVFFDDLKIRKPNYFLEAAGNNAAQTIGQVIIKSDEVMQKENPDAILLYGDTNSCLSVVAAKRRKIPVFHMEAGNRCFDQRVPEELNRKVLDHLSDINLVLTEHARRYLIAEGIKPETIIKTGSHMHEVLNYYGSEIGRSNVLSRLGLIPKKYFLVSTHREENVDSDENLQSLILSLNQIAKKYEYPIIISTHPRTQKRLNKFPNLNLDSKIKFCNPFGFFDYNKLQIEAYCVISDSGTITEESSLLGMPAIMIRNSHERPEGMDAGTLVMAGLTPERILDAIKIVTDQNFDNKLSFGKVVDYEVFNVSKKILRIVYSYTNYINDVIWRK